jgi:hypothetical protein
MQQIAGEPQGQEASLRERFFCMSSTMVSRSYRGAQPRFSTCS